MPPTPCTENTSKASSKPNLRFKTVIEKNTAILAKKPIMIAPNGPTNAAAGVIPTKPPIVPEARPNAVTWPATIFLLFPLESLCAFSQVGAFLFWGILHPGCDAIAGDLVEAFS